MLNSPITVELIGTLDLSDSYPQLVNGDKHSYIALVNLTGSTFSLPNGSRVQVKGSLSFDHLDRATLNVYSIAKI